MPHIREREIPYFKKLILTQFLSPKHIVTLMCQEKNNLNHTLKGSYFNVTSMAAIFSPTMNGKD